MMQDLKTFWLAFKIEVKTMVVSFLNSFRANSQKILPAGMGQAWALLNGSELQHLCLVAIKLFHKWHTGCLAFAPEVCHSRVLWGWTAEWEQWLAWPLCDCSYGTGAFCVLTGLLLLSLSSVSGYWDRSRVKTRLNMQSSCWNGEKTVTSQFLYLGNKCY